MSADMSSMRLPMVEFESGTFAISLAACGPIIFQVADFCTLEHHLLLSDAFAFQTKIVFPNLVGK